MPSSLVKVQARHGLVSLQNASQQSNPSIVEALPLEVDRRYPVVVVGDQRQHVRDESHFASAPPMGGSPTRGRTRQEGYGLKAGVMGLIEYLCVFICLHFGLPAEVVASHS